ncbi:MAG: serpin family protein [Tannerella sp.]|nr:serpin family protein [Tannerella sp.]
MKKIMFLLGGLVLLSCSNNDEPTIKTRQDVPLTKAEEQVVDGNNAFAFKLFNMVVQNDQANPNVFLSPFSAEVALAMLDNGAGGVSRSEIQAALGYASTDDMNTCFQKILAAMKDIDTEVTFETANSIWIKNNFPVLQPFIDTNKSYYGAEVQNADFSDPQTLSNINQWCSQQTAGKIPSILDNINPDDVIYLINALYFKGDWTSKFDQAKTTTKAFHNEDGTSSQVDMMAQTHDFAYGENEQAQFVELPYGNGAFSMVVILPKEGQSLSSVEGTLDAEQWGEMQNAMSNGEVNVQFPRFQMEYERTLNDDLDALGLHSIFSPETADFSNLSAKARSETSDINNQVYVSMVKQKTYIKVDENGTEAAAATVVGGTGATAAPPKTFYVDRPFLYLIKEKSTGTIFFIGAVRQL